ncbi:MAG: carbon-nitrogen hydrolase family protein [Promethearchaeota archaeon]
MVKIGVLQLQIRKDEDNFNKIEELINEAKEKGIEIVCLPEKWNAKAALDPIENKEGNVFQFLSKIAKKYKIFIVGGAILVKIDDKNYVVSYVFDNNGKCIGNQRKIHLYSYENQYITSGSELELINTELGIIGVAICFDLNAFPEVGRAYALNGADIVFNPSMISEVGIENWHIYLKARALENRMPVVGVNGVGKSPAGNLMTGESIIIGFHKGHESPAKLKIIQGEKNKEQLIFADLDLKYPQKIRQNRLSNIKSFKIKKN